MALTVTRSEGRNYLSIGFGKIRQKQLPNGQKVDETTAGATMRETDKGISYSIEYDKISGLIQDIHFKEDSQYGNSYEVMIYDNDERYQLSLKEDSRITMEFLKKLPNIDFKYEVELSPFDFTTKDNKRLVGITIKQNGEKIESFYSRKDGEKWITLNGYPEPPANMDWKNKKQLQRYSLDVQEFLLNEFKKIKFEPISEAQKTVVQSQPDVPATEDDLPF